jgi:hypothetical protein
MLEFNPTRSRDFWLRSHLKDAIDREPFSGHKEPPGIEHISHHAYAEMQTANLISGYLYGLRPNSRRRLRSTSPGWRASPNRIASFIREPE